MNLIIESSDVERWFMAGEYDPRRATEIAVADLKERAGNGDLAAGLTLDEWTLGGGRQALKRQFAALHEIAVPTEGARLPARMSIVRDDGSRQMVAWDFMTRDEFMRMLAEYRSQTTSRVTSLGLFERTKKVWDERPDIETAAKAFVAAGIAIEDIADVAA